MNYLLYFFYENVLNNRIKS